MHDIIEMLPLQNQSFNTANTSNLITLLLNAVDIGIINKEEVSLKVEEMKRKEILEQHKYAIKYNEKDNRWHTYVADDTKANGRRPVAKRKKEDLDNYLVDFYKKQLETEKPKTFKLAFECAIRDKMEHVKSPEKVISKKNTNLKYQSEYKRFIAGTDIEHKCVADITKKDIEQLCLLNLKRYNLKQKAFKSLRGILKITFDYAFEEYWITDNVYRRVDFSKYDDMLEPDTPIKERVHSDKEVSAILAELHRVQEIRPKSSSAWALEMQMIIGSRRGETPPLEWTDLVDGYLLIHKEQLVDDNKCVTVNHTKTGQDRQFPFANALKAFLKRLKERNDKYYPNCPYLFPNPDGTAPITGNAIYMQYRNTCKRLDIKIDKEVRKGPHSFRRNAITDVVNATNGNTILAASLFGNSPEVILKNYYTGIDFTQAKEALDSRQFIS